MVVESSSPGVNPGVRMTILISVAAGYISTREPSQLFEELTALMTRTEPSFQDELARADETLGAGFIQSLTSAMGTEAGFALKAGRECWFFS